jgi:hypothetical protein
MDSIIQGVVDYVTACPLLKNGLLRVDSLGSKPVEYVVEVLPCDPIVKQYVDGSSIRQYLFAIGSREYYALDMVQNISNSKFYEQLQQWFEEQNARENFPDIGDDKEMQEIQLVTSGYLFATDRKTARYQMQFRLVYFKEVTK